MLQILFKQLLIATLLIPYSLFAHERILNIYNWSDYIAKDTIKNFEKKTGIKVHYDVFDNDEILEAKLLAGSTGYDIVVPSALFLAHQIKANVYQTIDKNKLPNLKNLDPELLKLTSLFDPKNQHAIPYLWGTTGIGYNDKMIKQYLGVNAPTNSLDLIFKVNNIKKLTKCGVAFLNSPTDLIPTALKYLGLNPNSQKKDDYLQAQRLLTSIRPYITYFHSSKFISDLANGDICVAFGWSGDILQAQTTAKNAKNGINIKYSVPKEGAGLWFDMLAIPKDAQNISAAHEFLNYLLEPKVIADITNYVTYANPNQQANSLVMKKILNNNGIYPDPKTRKKLFVFQPVPPKIDRLMNRIFTKITTGQ